MKILLSLLFSIGVLYVTGQVHTVPPPGARIVRNTRDSLLFSNGVSASRNDLLRISLYWGLMLKQDSILAKTKPGADMYKDPIHRKYQDSMLYYTRRLPPFLRNAKMDLRKYRDSL